MPEKAMWGSPKLKHNLANIYIFFVPNWKNKKKNWVACVMVYEFINAQNKKKQSMHMRDIVDENVSYHSKQ